MGVEKLFLDDAEAVMRVHNFTQGTTWHGTDRVHCLAYKDDRTLLHVSGGASSHRGERSWYPAHVRVIRGPRHDYAKEYDIKVSENLTVAYVQSLIYYFNQPEGLKQEIQYLANKAMRLRNEAEDEKERQAKLKQMETDTILEGSKKLHQLIDWCSKRRTLYLPESFTTGQRLRFIEVVKDILKAEEEMEN